MTVQELLDLCRGTQNKRQFALAIGLAPITVTRIYQGKHGLTSRPVAALLVHYPQHKDAILDVFMNQK